MQSSRIPSSTSLRMLKGNGALLCVHDAGEFWAIFDNDYQAALGDGMVESRGPALTCRTCDVQELKRLAVITVSGIPYKLNKYEPDGTGMTVLFLGK